MQTFLEFGTAKAEQNVEQMLGGLDLPGGDVGLKQV